LVGEPGLDIFFLDPDAIFLWTDAFPDASYWLDLVLCSFAACHGRTLLPSCLVPDASALVKLLVRWYCQFTWTAVIGETVVGPLVQWQLRSMVHCEVITV